MAPGQIIILNGAPRAGKSRSAAAIQESFGGIWMNIGVDAFVRHVTPPALLPGIGLRPGGERPDLERHLPRLYEAFYGAVAAHSRLGLNVVVDAVHHDAYKVFRSPLSDFVRRSAESGTSAVLRCPRRGEVVSLEPPA